MTAEWDARRMFEAVLRTDELRTEEGDGSLPDLRLIRREGGRRARRGLLRGAGVTAAVLAVAGGLAVGLPRQSAPAAPSGSGRGTSLAGAESSPAKPPTDMRTAVMTPLTAELMSVLRRHLPPGLTLEPGLGPTTFTLRHPDGSTSTLGALVGLQHLGAPPSPCPTYGAHCVPVTLPDSSQGWASVGLDGRSASVALYTLDGQAFGLSDGDDGVNPGTRDRESGIPLTERQLIALVEQPDVYRVLQKVPTDEVTPEPAGSAYRP
ncbi:hypothetical protein [Streptacidiphilus jiangxiensis]|uniref:Uncharacterized protein n=1 Tax=Streptacidiphilus jiangxiensis TaxID=235985 RepID=A0A1H8BSG0_STRJI|nr:hypothetical protein [Streptacidiphilus jiangxiensis]SEM85074.1 hypothetical protein SAMN05414137_1754 [Streptacidiphilus jiangxiensis]